jgi:hypothetical protein
VAEQVKHVAANPQQVVVDSDQKDYNMAWRTNQKKGMYDNKFGLGGGHSHLAGDTESKSYNKMHTFNYCMKKAGMENVDEEKVQNVLANTGSGNVKYFVQQESKNERAETKIAQFKEKIAQYQKNE